MHTNSHPGLWFIHSTKSSIHNYCQVQSWTPHWCSKAVQFVHITGQKKMGAHCQFWFSVWSKRSRIWHNLQLLHWTSTVQKWNNNSHHNTHLVVKRFCGIAAPISQLNQFSHYSCATLSYFKFILYFFPSVISHWNSLPQSIVSSPSLCSIKRSLYTHPHYLILIRLCNYGYTIIIVYITDMCMYPLNSINI